MYRYTTFEDCPEKVEIGHEVLDIIHKAFKHAGVTYWIDFGTLLGFMREGTFIPHDYDIDIGIIPVSDIGAKAIKVLERSGIEYTGSFEFKDHIKDEYFGNRDTRITESMFIYKGVQVDLWHHHWVEKCVRFAPARLVAGWAGSEVFELPVNVYCSETIPSPATKSKVNIISDFRRYLNLVYGEDWMTPKRWVDGGNNEFMHCKEKKELPTFEYQNRISKYETS